MKNIAMTVALFVSLASIMAAKGYKKHLSASLRQKDAQVAGLQAELRQTKADLTVAKKKLGFLDKYKQRIQVTAYTARQGSRFANGTKTAGAYAVRGRSLPQDRLMCVALSPPAQHRLNAKFNDLIVLVRRRGEGKSLARFVDTTSAEETRPVVDVFFEDDWQARLWGRKTGEYYAVNISMVRSPFRE